MNLCRECGEDFSSVRGFDFHRVGRHEYTYSQGLKFEPMVEDGRRCLSTGELHIRGFRHDERGRWYDPSQNPAARFSKPQHATEAFL